MIANINTLLSTIITPALSDGWAMTKKPVSLEIPYTSQCDVTPGILQGVKKDKPWTVKTEKWIKAADLVSSIENNSSTTHPSISKPLMFILDAAHHAVAAARPDGGLHHAVHHAPVHAVHAVHAPVVAHAVHAPVVAHHAVHAPVVVKAAPAYHAPAYHAPVKAGYVADDLAEQSPYTFTYAVADDYSKANFNAEETSDGASNVQGSYSVALPDGRIQHFKYSSNGYDGLVADVTYEGTAVYPEEPVYKAAPAYHAPAPAYHA